MFRVICTVAGLVERYAKKFGWATKAEIKARLTMAPFPFRFICWTAYFVTSAVPITFVANDRRQSSTVASNPFNMNAAALLTRISSRPNALAASAEMLLASSSFEVSA